MRYLIIAIATFALASAFWFVVLVGIARAERVECLRWQEQSREYPAWYSMAWQRAQCEARGVPLN